ncbi:hypothetical protein [Argonema galeatum]|uniref:hypothetical protein n=1 Tax=Argonema galeatum TaxID=2942762 RepID=UPI0020128AFC|nr:hypothetical protein [Argonema galeatum]MCL1465277.1 hypothetical protein [Argonema galeatum A003/A1]
MAIKQISLDKEQLIEFQQWKEANGYDFSLWDFLFGVANIEIALAFTQLFWPDFVEHQGGIFLTEAFDLEIYQQWKEKLGNDINAIERVMNHQHIDDILPGAEKVGIDNLYYLGDTIAQMWSSRLKLVYPDRTFQVNSDRDEHSVIVTFYQIIQL